MKNLILIRHGKSSWEFNKDDFDRPLAERGISDAGLVAQHVAHLLPQPYVIYSSSAVRARETAIQFALIFDYPLDKIELSNSLYTFDEHKLESEIRSLPDKHQNVILFGHNEAITNFVNKFGDMYIDNVSTSGFVSLAFESDNWQSINRGKIVNIVFPRDLKP